MAVLGCLLSLPFIWRLEDPLEVVVACLAPLDSFLDLLNLYLAKTLDLEKCFAGRSMDRLGTEVYQYTRRN